jgi:hypothetical protein
VAKTGAKQEWESPTLTVLGDLEGLTMNTPPTTSTDALDFAS